MQACKSAVEVVLFGHREVVFLGKRLRLHSDVERADIWRRLARQYLVQLTAAAMNVRAMLLERTLHLRVNEDTGSVGRKLIRSLIDCWCSIRLERDLRVKCSRAGRVVV